MNFKEAVKIIKERSNWKIIDIDWDKKIIKLEGLWGEFEILNAAKVIGHARYFTSEKGGEYKNDVKYFGAKKNRRETRDLLNKEDYDSIPQQGRCRDEDPWGWD